MRDVEAFWELGALSDHQVLEGLQGALGSGRRLLAELVAHLAEVEGRRLHLRAASSSMFHYCVTRLGLSEDEACRRIDVARLARRYLAIFPLLASGELSLSVAALLKPHLSMENHAHLLAAVRGKSVQQAREALAALFPRPDVPSVVRKLPERAVTQQTALASTAPANTASQNTTSPGTAPPPTHEATSLCALATQTSLLHRHTEAPRSAPRIEPLSAARYKVQFTASAPLKAKLELARDLMRHAHPSGDFAPIVERALDLLIERLMKRRFGDSAAPERSSAATRHAGTRHAATRNAATHELDRSDDAPRVTVAEGGRVAEPACPVEPRYIDRSARRTVLNRDGLGCSWVDEQGVRCNARAWLEHDHCQPRAKGGGSQPDNLRLLCRAHNCLEAELAYGRAHVERVVAQRQQKRRRQSEGLGRACTSSAPSSPRGASRPGDTG